MTTAMPMVRIVSTGRYLPERVLTNQELESMVDTTDDWIRERTGIRERRIAAEGESTADMGAAAARIAMERAGVEPEDIDMLVLSTATPDRLLPSTACDMQALLGCTNAAAMDVTAACTGFLYALGLVEGLIAMGRADTVLVVASEKMSAITDWTDRNTCVLFGDAAGAVVVQRTDSESGILSQYMRSDGRLGELLWRPAGGADIPIDAKVIDDKSHLLQMEGPETFRHAVRSMTDASEQALTKAGLTGADVDLMVPHQANLRIIQATAKYAGIPMEKVVVNLDRYGNTSSATIPVAIDEAVEAGRLKEGDILLTAAFGAGFTWGSIAMRW